jgi:chemosensory pili system protein ChpA (sensor histidine kinase/response regulator)
VLLTNLLYFAAHARSKGKQIAEVKSVFKLNDYFPPESVLQAARSIFSGPDIELMKVVVTLLKDDFARVEETLDIFNRADSPSVAELAPLVGMLKDMANTLGLLGLLSQRKLMLQQAALILEVSEGRKSAQLSTLLDIASALLKISAALDILAVQGVHARQLLQQGVDTQFWDTPQFGLMLSVVVDEAKTELTQVVQPLVTFIDSRTRDEALVEVPNRLKQVEGCLSVLSHDRAAKLLARCNQYIEKIFIKEGVVPAEEKLKALADVIISIEVYLDTLAGNPMDGKDILDITERRLAILFS